ncbi:MAG TPA: hydroxymethylglutaryl-CoA reductase [Desulfobacteraceae bacterium]|nr:hydroxymethylglutaryl-CoA reductase [Desulfobacteraceae bacterium]
MRNSIPRENGASDYTRKMADMRRAFVQQQTGVETDHLGRYSFDPKTLPGNIELFSGAAQVPIGLAGPLLMDGEHAKGEFYVPMATTEGTLVASYNRGMKIVYESGGVKATVMDDAMQRAPVFHFENAGQAKKFGQWVRRHFDGIKAVAENTTRIGKLRDIEQYPASKMMFLRFNFTTGDAAGQNMVGKATFAACEWIRQQYPGIKRYVLSGNLDTDKKASQINILRTRGKKVVAEATIKKSAIEKIAGVPVDLLVQQRQVSTLGCFMSGANNNGSHSANGTTALFIATGQDAANVAESSAAMVYVEKTTDGDYYFSITLPSLIVGTFGGGTGLATQRECLEILGCYGKGNACKFAEIVAATVLCGELSLMSAVMAGDWVSSHDQYGRNR